MRRWRSAAAWCGAVAILRAGGPVRVPFRRLLVAAILLAEAQPMLCRSASFRNRRWTRALSTTARPADPGWPVDHRPARRRSCSARRPCCCCGGAVPGGGAWPGCGSPSPGRAAATPGSFSRARRARRVPCLIGRWWACRRGRGRRRRRPVPAAAGTRRGPGRAAAGRGRPAARRRPAGRRAAGGRSGRPGGFRRSPMRSAVRWASGSTGGPVAAARRRAGGGLGAPGRRGRAPTGWSRPPSGPARAAVRWPVRSAGSPTTCGPTVRSRPRPPPSGPVC